MDKDIAKKFKSILSQQISLQGQLKTINERMLAAIKESKESAIKSISEEADHLVEQMDTLERDRIELLSPYIEDKERLKRFASFINEFPKDEIEPIKKIYAELKEKTLHNFEQTRINQLLLNEAVSDLRKNVEMINTQVNRPIKYGFDGEKQAALPTHLVNKKG